MAEILQQEEVWLPWLILMETYYISRQEQAEAERRYALLNQLPVTLLWEVNEQTLLTAARLKALYRISLADAIMPPMPWFKKQYWCIKTQSLKP